MPLENISIRNGGKTGLGYRSVAETKGSEEALLALIVARATEFIYPSLATAQRDVAMTVGSRLGRNRAARDQEVLEIYFKLLATEISTSELTPIQVSQLDVRSNRIIFSILRPRILVGTTLRFAIGLVLF